MMARDGVRLLEDPIEFGKEWQVLDSEPMLFHVLGEGVHHPDECEMPAAGSKKPRRLGESLMTEEEAIVACADVNEEDKVSCIYDVLVTNDKGMVGAWR